VHTARSAGIRFRFSYRAIYAIEKIGHSVVLRPSFWCVERRRVLLSPVSLSRWTDTLPPFPRKNEMIGPVDVSSRMNTRGNEDERFPIS
jgi:hypothetical protein